MQSLLRKYLARRFKYDWVFGVMLILLFGIPRFALVLHSYEIKNYGMVMPVFVVMWFTPLLLLNMQGRRAIGIRRPNRWWRLPLSFLFGASFCALIVLLFTGLYGTSVDNAFVYIAGNSAGGNIAPADRALYFWVSVIPSMLFSPIGEELLYRGVIHQSFVPRFGERTASVFDSLAFALTHVAHFGIIFVAGAWLFTALPAMIWVVSMFFASQVFFRCKRYCDSIWGAVFSHAGFNFMMMYVIFYHIL